MHQWLTEDSCPTLSALRVSLKNMRLINFMVLIAVLQKKGRAVSARPDKWFNSRKAN